jgi:hypothetical protein
MAPASCSACYRLAPAAVRPVIPAGTRLSRIIAPGLPASWRGTVIRHLTVAPTRADTSKLMASATTVAPGPNLFFVNPARIALTAVGGTEAVTTRAAILL